MVRAGTSYQLVPICNLIPICRYILHTDSLKVNITKQIMWLFSLQAHHTLPTHTKKAKFTSFWKFCLKCWVPHLSVPFSIPSSSIFENNEGNCARDRKKTTSLNYSLRPKCKWAMLSRKEAYVHSYSQEWNIQLIKQTQINEYIFSVHNLKTATFFGTAFLFRHWTESRVTA